ncbi:MAG TPA: polysaccharide deacetylase family protein [Steroidobacteraceae bacterium]|nr:polysaccharide deacetylase family protein [Steroidobacteraceae bacterium]
MSPKPCASLSLDLDNQWSYMKTHGDPAWREFPSYLDVAVPRILEFLRARDLKISFFIVGQDAALERNREPLRALAEAGHEIGNHSFNHEPWLHLYSEEQLDAELAKAEQHIEAATGVKPVGFRGPGFSLSNTTLRVLARRGYLYDATVFPNLLNPLARAYFFATSNLSKEEKEQRKALFGTWADALKPLKPYRWDLEGRQLLEIPVTTLPLFKVPIHLSYILYLSKFSRPIARLYFRFALAMCALTRTQPSILLHPLDFLGKEDCKELAFFPGMDLPRERKLALVAEALDLMASKYELLTMRGHAERLMQGTQLKLMQLQPEAA